MRHQPSASLLRLARRLMGTAEGLTIQEIMAELGVARRTAERMRAALATVFPELEELVGADRHKRWVLRAPRVVAMSGIRAAELASLRGVVRQLAQGNDPARAEDLRTLADKIEAGLRPAEQHRLGPDLELLLEAEGLAARPGPRSRIDRALLDLIRAAILAGRKLAFDYTNREGLCRRHTGIEPHGLLYGSLPYLVGFAGKGADPMLLRLAAIGEPELLADSFTRRPGFELAAFAARSFGVFQEQPTRVVLRFTPAVAATVGSFHFHPTQQLTPGPDGSTTVRFTSGGRRELLHHLITWGDEVQVVAPAGLRRELAAWLKTLAGHHAVRPARVAAAGKGRIVH